MPDQDVETSAKALAACVDRPVKAPDDAPPKKRRLSTKVPWIATVHGSPAGWWTKPKATSKATSAEADPQDPAKPKGKGRKATSKATSSKPTPKKPAKAKSTRKPTRRPRARHPLKPLDSLGELPDYLQDKTFSEDFIKEMFKGLADSKNINDFLANAVALGRMSEDGEIVVRLGTVCSGSELLMTVLPHVEQACLEHTGYKLRFEHLWSCEIEEDKCRWIAANFAVPKIFVDICTMANEEGGMEWRSGELQKPEEVDVVVGGTSCKDASRMNKHQQTRRGAVSSGGWSTGSTFQGYLKVVVVVNAKLVLVENVTGLKDKVKKPIQGMLHSNSEALKKHFHEIDFIFVSMVLESHGHCHMPHRRERLWMAGLKFGAVSIADMASQEMILEQRTRAVASNITLMTKGAMQAWALQDFLVPIDTSTLEKVKAFEWFPEFVAEDNLDQDKKVCKGWFDLHQRYWSKLTSEDRMRGATLTLGSMWVAPLSARCQDLLALLYSGHPVTGEERIWDIAQNMGRLPCGVGKAPCSMPKGIPWLHNVGRPLAGVESLLLQGADPRYLPALRHSTWGSRFLQDLSGNGFNGPVFAMWFSSLLCSMPSTWSAETQ